MVPACSHKVPRVSWYSGYRHVCFPFMYGAFTLSGWLSQNHSTRITESIMRSEPRSARTPVWPLSISLAATLEIEFSFFSSPYLDVSVQAVPLHTLCIHVWMHELLHADCSIRKSADQCLLTTPRSLSQLTTSFIGSQCQGIRPALLFALPFVMVLSSLLKTVVYPTSNNLHCFCRFLIVSSVTFLLFNFQDAFVPFFFKNRIQKTTSFIF